MDSPHEPSPEAPAARALLQSVLRHSSTEGALIRARETAGESDEAEQALTTLAAGLRVSVNEALAALSDDDWRQLARELRDEAQSVPEPAVA
jgi:hypothetical protein